MVFNAFFWIGHSQYLAARDEGFFLMLPFISSKRAEFIFLFKLKFLLIHLLSNVFRVNLSCLLLVLD